MLKEKRLQTVQAAEKTIRLLEVFGSGNRRMPIGELSRVLELSRREALLLLVTMENLGVLCWNAEKRIYVPAARGEALAGRVGGKPRREAAGGGGVAGTARQESRALSA